MTNSEITVILKDDERTFKQKILAYENYTIDTNDPYLQQCVAEAMAQAKFEPTDITIKISITL